MGINWDKNVETMDFEGLKDDTYEFLIVKAEAKIPKSSIGEMLSLELDVISANAQGRKHFENWCYIHTNENVQNIANQNIKLLAAATGIDDLNEESQLIGKRFNAQLKTSKCGQYQNMYQIKKHASTQKAEPTAGFDKDPFDDDIGF